MKAVILAGGKGTRISEESILRPKPMVEIGGKPIIWHIMKIFSAYGINDFIICCGYKGFVIKEYFLKYFNNTSDIEISLNDGKIDTLQDVKEEWKVTLIDTGLNTLTGGRILKLKEYLGEEPFIMTYGDGVADIDIKKLLKAHKDSKQIATVTLAKPEGRFGSVKIDRKGVVTSFREKDVKDEVWVNAGFAVFEKEIFEYLGEGDTMLEEEPYRKLARERKMNAYKHSGFWHPMDTLRDKENLEKIWTRGEAPWEIWE